MDKELIKLIEDNGLTLHGDFDFFAHLIAEREREACADLCEGHYDTKQAARAIRERGEHG